LELHKKYISKKPSEACVIEKMGILDMYVMATLVINLSNEISEKYLKITEDAMKAID